MRQKNILLFFTSILLSGLIQNSKAQTIKVLKYDFTINTGYAFPNVAGKEFSSQGTGSNGNGISPIYVEVGYNLSDKVLLSFFFSDASSNTGNFTWLDTAMALHNYHYSVSIVTFGFSGRYYLGNGLNFRPFLGAMLGYDLINLSTDDLLPQYGSVTVAHSQGEFIYQVYAGATYYFNKWLGLEARAGYGNSYYAAVGLSFRLQLTQKEYSR